MAAELDTGFDRPTLAELVTRISGDLESRLPGEDASVPFTDLYVLARVIAGGVHLVHGFAEQGARNVIVDASTGAILTRHGDIWGIPALAASFATGDLSFTATGVGTVPLGAEFARRADGLTYEALAAVPFVAGPVTIGVRAQVAGAAGNAVAGVIVDSVQPIMNLVSEGTVLADIIDGGDAETEDAHRARILERIRGARGAGSTADDYVVETRRVSTVDRVFVTPNELGAGTVGVRFTVVATSGLASDAIPGGAKVTEVQTALDAFRPVTAQVTVVGLVAEIQPFTIAITPDTPAIRTAVEAELNALFIRDGSPAAAVGGGTVPNSKIREAISRAEGEDFHTLTVPAGDIVVGANGFPTVGVITFT